MCTGFHPVPVAEQKKLQSSASGGHDVDGAAGDQCELFIRLAPCLEGRHYQSRPVSHRTRPASLLTYPFFLLLLLDESEFVSKYTAGLLLRYPIAFLLTCISLSEFFTSNVSSPEEISDREILEMLLLCGSLRTTCFDVK